MIRFTVKGAHNFLHNGVHHTFTQGPVHQAPDNLLEAPAFQRAVETGEVEMFDSAGIRAVGQQGEAGSAETQPKPAEGEETAEGDAEEGDESGEDGDAEEDEGSAEGDEPADAEKAEVTDKAAPKAAGKSAKKQGKGKGKK